MDQLLKTINSRVKRITKFAANKVTKKDLPRVVSLTVQTRAVKHQNFTIVTLFGSLKRKKLSEKDKTQSFSEVFEIARILTLNPLTFSLIDSFKEIIQGKLYQPGLRESLNQNDY